jgi:hypothetical protein
MTKKLPKIVPLGSGTFDSWQNYQLQQNGVDVYEHYGKCMKTEQNPLTNVPQEVQSCMVDYPPLYPNAPWYDPTGPGHGGFKDHTIIPGIGKLQPYTVTVVQSPLPLNKWTNKVTEKYVVFSIDLPGVKEETLDVYVERGNLYVNAKRDDNGFSVRENVTLPIIDINVDD